MRNNEFQERVREECDLPEGWQVAPYTDFGFEVSSFDGETETPRALEITAEDLVVEIVIRHRDMPGRIEALEMSQGETPEKPYLELPSTVGVLQFYDEDVEHAVTAINALADRDVLDKLAEKRDFVERDEQMGVLEAVEEVAGIDPTTVTSTTDSI
ncbi:hypothetical protein C471_08530 [Halorubrum saccharovorum DSM 1137]|uniref:Uncharacterized protein n=1 Tax=Halorubrum saccharovorum DSM 1137 TaxID=1227484 RepID=M0DUX8_9EURY|nr:hypothetical protein [Halorubrum saccharovorum]ELZ39311.1 hypothetical protein C471_08530 [Halorubrum saccharovorum DSM 1137]